MPSRIQWVIIGTEIGASMRGMLTPLVVLGVVASALMSVTSRATPPAVGLPWVVDGEVDALAVADGKLFVGGQFKQVAAPTGPLVAFTLRGRRDAGFPSVELQSDVAVMVGDGHGGFYLGGSFKSIGGVACGSLAHVRRGGVVDRNFCPRPDGAVRALARLGSRLYVGGEFRRIAGVARRSLAALDLRSGRATAFHLVNAPYSVWQLEATAGAVYAVGDLTFVALDPASGKRLSFAPKPDATRHGDSVTGFARAGTRVYAWGYFSRIGGKRCGGLAVLDARSGGEIECELAQWVRTGVVSAGVLYVGGSFKSVMGQKRPGLAALSAATGRLLPWKAPGLPAGVERLAVAGDVLYAAGPISPRPNSGSIVAARSVRTGAAVAFAAQRFNGGVSTIAPIGNRIVVGGGFRSIGGTSHPNLLAVDVASGRPLPWKSGIPDAAVDELSVVGSTVYVAGYFARAGGQPRNDFAAFDARSDELLPWRPQVDYTYGLAATAGSVYTAPKVDQLVELDPRTGAVRRALAMPGGVNELAASEVLFDAAFDGDQASLVALEMNPLRIAGTLDFTVDAPVSLALTAEGSRVYIGGSYSRLAGVNQAYLARLHLENDVLRVDGWRPQLPGPAVALSLDGNTVAVAGLTPDETRWYVALVDGRSAKVTILGYGEADNFDTVRAIAVSGSNVYVGGTFGLQRLER